MNLDKKLAQINEWTGELKKLEEQMKAKGGMIDAMLKDIITGDLGISADVPVSLPEVMLKIRTLSK